MPLQVNLSCAVLCHIVSLRYLSRSSLHRLVDLPIYYRHITSLDIGHAIEIDVKLLCLEGSFCIRCV